MIYARNRTRITDHSNKQQNKNPRMATEPADSKPRLFRISKQNCHKIVQLDKKLKAITLKYKTQLAEHAPSPLNCHLQLFHTIHDTPLSKVYKARNLQTGQHFALKKVTIEEQHQNREESICRVLRNNFIVQIIDVYYSSTAQQEFNVLMKLYKWDLSDFISTKPVLDRLSLKILLYQMARALHYLHIKGICHRDVRPSNFLMDQNGRVRLTDFGSAKAVKTNDTSLCYLGSRPYRAPQLLLGCDHYSSAVDVWALGCIALQLLTGRQPFNGSSTIDCLLNIARYLGSRQLKKVRGNQQLTNILPSIKGRGLVELVPNDEELLDLVTKMLSIDADKRILAIDILVHPFFEQLRDEQVYVDLIRKKIDISYFFDFTQTELRNCEQYRTRLVPIWKRDRPDKHSSNAK